jgi:hypothetical protein
MEENQTLRNLLRGLSSFIGDGAGGLLPKMGWDMTDFNNFVNRSETDTAWESYQKRKSAPADSSVSQEPQGQKRPADVDNSTLRWKKSRGASLSGSDTQDRFNVLMPIPSGAHQHHSNPSYSASSKSQEGSLFPPMFVQPQSSVTPSTQFNGSPSSNVSTYPTSYMSPVNMNADSPSAPLTFPPTNANGPIHQSLTALENGQNAGKDEEYKLIQCVFWPRPRCKSTHYG